MRSRTLLYLLAAAMLTSLARAATAPTVAAENPSDLGSNLPYPFHSGVNADRAVAKATTRAAASGKLLLIDLGGNWCADCRILAGVMDLPTMKPFMAAH